MLDYMTIGPTVGWVLAATFSAIAFVCFLLQES